jgi:hypothetical protein
MMSQARSHTFELKNAGAVELHVGWSIDSEGKEDPFTVLPQEGTIAAGEAMQVTVTFSPQEVDSFARTLRCAVVAREYGRGSVPRKTSLNWTMPEFVNINVGSLRGTSGLDATTSWPLRL